MLSLVNDDRARTEFDQAPTRRFSSVAPLLMVECSTVALLGLRLKCLARSSNTVITLWTCRTSLTTQLPVWLRKTMRVARTRGSWGRPFLVPTRSLSHAPRLNQWYCVKLFVFVSIFILFRSLIGWLEAVWLPVGLPVLIVSFHLYRYVTFSTSL